jgi:hypothetical protein
VEISQALGNKGASQPYIHQKIIFGEFLEIVANGNNGAIPVWSKNLAFSQNITTGNNLTEGRFRKYWEITADLKGDEPAR